MKTFFRPYGPAADQCLDKLIEELKNGDALAPVTVIVPSTYAGLSLRRNLRVAEGLVNVRFMVLPRLAEFIAAPNLVTRSMTPTSSLIKFAVIQHVATSANNKGPMSSVAGQPRLHVALGASFQSLDKLPLASLDRLAVLDPLRAQLVSWYRTYKSLLGNHYDHQALYSEACSVLQEGAPKSLFWDLGHVIFHLPCNLSPAEIKLISRLVEMGLASVILGLTGDREVDEALFRTAAKLDPASRPPGDDIQESYNVHHLVIAHSTEEEVQWITRDIMRQAEAGTTFQRLAVLYHDAYPYAELVQSRLRLAGIPAAGPATTGLKNTIAGKLLTGLLSVIENGYSRDAVMHLIAESPIRALPEGFPAIQELSRWETISCNAGIIKGANQWIEKLAAYCRSLDRQLAAGSESESDNYDNLREQKKSARWLANFSRELVDSTTIAVQGSYASYSEWLKNLLAKYIAELSAWSETDQQSYDEVIGLLDEIGTLDPVLKSSCNFSGIASLLNTSLEQPSGRIGAFGSGVFVGSVAAAQGMIFDTAYIVGMAEGSFPSRPGIDSLLPDEVRSQFQDDDALPLSWAATIRERRQFIAAKAAARRRVLSFSQTGDSSQREQYPSPWFQQEAIILNGQPLDFNRVAKYSECPWLTVIYSAEDAMTQRESLPPADTHDYDMANLARWCARSHRPERHYLLREGTSAGRAMVMEKARTDGCFSEWTGNLSSLAATSQRLRVAGRPIFSASRLEKWASCPFNYFLNYVLDIQVIDRPEEIMTISPMDRGTLVHHILERFASSLMEQNRLPDYGQPWAAEHEEYLMLVADEEFGLFEANGMIGHDVMWQLAREDIKRDLSTLLVEDSRLRQECDSKIMWAEKTFDTGRAEAIPPVRFDIGGREIRLRGKIDRADINRDGSRCLVIDYKTGGAAGYYGMKSDPLENGRRLQLPIYAMAAQSYLNTPVKLNACYWFISKKGEFKKIEVALSDVEQRLKEVIAAIVCGIEQGIFPANPTGDPNKCQNCDYIRICSADRDASWEKMVSDPQISLYLKLQDAGQASGEGDTNR